MYIKELKPGSCLFAAPMAGISDKPFRALCYAMGAGITFSEMLSSNPKVWKTDKSRLRHLCHDESGIKAIQIAGHDPMEMAAAAQFNIENGAQLIDINMGCPAKKVNRKLAGSALLLYPEKVKEILSAVVNAVNVPVTLKIRTGWDQEHRNCVKIAQIAEYCGISAITIHGRTRACGFGGNAEYDSIKEVKQQITIPVIANGDITTPHKAKAVLDYTRADAVMIGRAALGRPWIFREIQHYMDTGKLLPSKPFDEVVNLIIQHIESIHHFYGDIQGVRIARKHVGWYLHKHAPNDQFRRTFNTIEQADEQLLVLKAYLENLRNT